MKIFIAHFTCFAFLLQALFIPRIAYADEEVATVREGEPAPFTGTLFSTEATARMLAELQLTEEACDLRVSQAVELKEAEMQLSLDQLQIRYDTSQDIFNQRLEIRDSQIDFMERELTRVKVHPAWLFVAGVVIGSGVAIGTAAAMNQVSQ